MLLKIELENNDEINTSQITKKNSALNLEAVCNEKILFFLGSKLLPFIYSYVI